MTAVVTDEKRAKMMAAIRGLLAKTEASGATVEEASAAAEKAQALAFKYHIDLAAAAQDDGARTLVIGRRRVECKYRDRWQKDIMHHIAGANFCKTVYWNGTKVVEVIGAEHNIEVCAHLHAYLVREILRLGRDHWKAVGKWEGADDCTWVNNFAKGATVSIGRRLCEQAARTAQADATTTALVVVSAAALEAAYREMYPNLGKAKATKARGDSSYYAGRRAGESIALSAAVGGGPGGTKALRG